MITTPAPAPPRGDEADLYRRHHRNLQHAVARAVNALRELIEDACQTAWTIMLRSQPDRAAIFAWLRVVVRHTLVPQPWCAPRAAIATAGTAPAARPTSGAEARAARAGIHLARAASPPTMQPTLPKEGTQMMFRHTRRAPLATLIAVAALAMSASSASAADGPPPQPDPRVPIAVMDTGMFEHEWLKGVQRELGSDDVWDVEHDGYADAAVSAAGGSRPFWPAAFDLVLA